MSLVYVAVCRLFELAVLLGRGDRSKELEILVLRHELSILRRQDGRPRFEPRDRLLLAALSRVLPRRSWRAFIVRPETLCGGIGDWSLTIGHIRTDVPVGRRSAARCASSSCGWHARTRAGAMYGSLASCASSASTPPQQSCARS